MKSQLKQGLGDKKNKNTTRALLGETFRTLDCRNLTILLDLNFYLCLKMVEPFLFLVFILIFRVFSKIFRLH